MSFLPFADYVPIQAAPSNFTGTGESESSIRLQWRPSQYNCDVSGYMIKGNDLVQDFEVLVPGGDADNFLVEELRAGTTYRFSIKPLLIIDRELDYGLAIEAATLPFTGKD